MVYRGMDIGTAKPSSALRARVPHHLIDVADPLDTYSAGRFVRDGRKAVEEVSARGGIPVLAGGTLLYLRALRDGLADLPEADQNLRRRFDEEAEAQGWSALHRRLETVDPAAAKRISPADRQRIQRALEVYELTGESLTSLQAGAAVSDTIPVQTLALVPEDRADLARRIEERFDAMVEAGFIDEVRALKARGDLSADTPAMRAVGYRQIWAFLDGETDWPQARDRAVAATRRLAKRQMTWLRSDASVNTLSTQSDTVAETVAGYVRARIV